MTVAKTADRVIALLVCNDKNDVRSVGHGSRLVLQMGLVGRSRLLAEVNPFRGAAEDLVAVSVTEETAMILD